MIKTTNMRYYKSRLVRDAVVAKVRLIHTWFRNLLMIDDMVTIGELAYWKEGNYRKRNRLTPASQWLRSSGLVDFIKVPVTCWSATHSCSQGICSETLDHLYYHHWHMFGFFFQFFCWMVWISDVFSKRRNSRLTNTRQFAGAWFRAIWYSQLIVYFSLCYTPWTIYYNG